MHSCIVVALTDDDKAPKFVTVSGSVVKKVGCTVSMVVFIQEEYCRISLKRAGYGTDRNICG